MLGAGSMVSQGGRTLIRLATTGTMLSGLGVAGAGLYGNQVQDPRVDSAQAFIQENAKLFIIVGVALLVLGFVLNLVLMQRMQKRMMAGMGLGGAGGMGGMGMGMPGMPDLAAMRGLQAAAAPSQIKVRCPSCTKLQAETATYCADCGKPMMPVAPSAP